MACARHTLDGASKTMQFKGNITDLLTLIIYQNGELGVPAY